MSAHDHTWQHQRIGGVRFRRARKPPQVKEEHHDEHLPHEHGRHRYPRERTDGGEGVDRRALADGCDDPQGQRQEERDQHTADGELHGISDHARDAFAYGGQLLGVGTLVAERAIADVAQKQTELFDLRSVQVHALANLRALLVVSVLACELVHRVARDQVNEQEHQHRYTQDGDEAGTKAAKNERTQRHSRSL